MVLFMHVAQMSGTSFGAAKKLHKRKQNELNSVYDGGPWQKA